MTALSTADVAAEAMNRAESASGMVSALACYDPRYTSLADRLEALVAEMRAIQDAGRRFRYIKIVPSAPPVAGCA